MKLSFLFTVKYPLVRFGWRGQSRDSIGTVLCVDDDGILRVGFPGASRGWRADPAEIERVEEYKVGNWVRIRPSLTVAVHGMESITPGSVGIVYSIRPDSSLLLGLCYLSNPWLCEPEEVEHVDPFKVIFLNYLPFNIIYGLFVSCFPHIFLSNLLVNMIHLLLCACNPLQLRVPSVLLWLLSALLFTSFWLYTSF